MLIGQLAIFPAMIKEIGIATWSRTGCLLAVGASALVPHAKALSWNKASLFAVSATSSTLVKFGESAVGERQSNSFHRDTGPSAVAPPPPIAG